MSFEKISKVWKLRMKMNKERYIKRDVQENKEEKYFSRENS